MELWGKVSFSEWFFLPIFYSLYFFFFFFVLAAVTKASLRGEPFLVSDGLFDEEKRLLIFCNPFFSVEKRDLSYLLLVWELNCLSIRPSLGEGEWGFSCAYFPSLPRKSCYFGHLKYGKGRGDKSRPGVSQRTVRSGLLVTLLSVSICQSVTFFSY